MCRVVEGGKKWKLRFLPPLQTEGESSFLDRSFRKWVPLSALYFFYTVPKMVLGKGEIVHRRKVLTGRDRLALINHILARLESTGKIRNKGERNVSKILEGKRKGVDLMPALFLSIFSSCLDAFLPLLSKTIFSTSTWRNGDISWGIRANEYNFLTWIFFLSSNKMMVLYTVPFF